ncbi:MAG: hypothetical protein AAGI37_18510 [Planctomycetota bacterium]
MHLPRLAQTLSAVLLLAAVSLLTAPAKAQLRDRGFDEPIVIRQTIPDPQAVSRTPLTSDRLSTTSTRLIDARRGFRPYSSVRGDGFGFRRYAGYDDHFGISRPENRPFSYSQRAPRTSVSQFRNDSRPSGRTAISPASFSTGYNLVLRDERTEPAPKRDLKIRIHNDKTATPETSGAVLITADGTVIQIGD